MLCTHVFPLDDAAKAFEVANDPGQSVKVQFVP
jgi:threonine dehydrogenase-like Zn-dependent dehydrogenase